jgi:hypothetical protein
MIEFSLTGITSFDTEFVNPAIIEQNFSEREKLVTEKVGTTAGMWIEKENRRDFRDLKTGFETAKSIGVRASFDAEDAGRENKPLGGWPDRGNFS